MSKFNHIVKISVFALAIAIFGLAPLAQAKSERGHNNRSSSHSFKNKGSNHSFNRHSSRKNFSNRSSKRNFSNRSSRRNFNRHSNRRSYSSYGYRGNYGYGGSYGYYGGHRGGHGGEVALGLLTGGLLFYALTANQRNNDTVYVQQQPVYVQPEQQQQWTQRQPVQPQNLDSSCLQVREYQTTITVGNQSVPAYGQSCLQPDGSWKLGPAIPEPGY